VEVPAVSDAHSSSDWYRISEARPRLRRDVRVIRHMYLGQPWYILSNRTGTKVHRLTAAAQEVAGRLDGRNSVEEIWLELSDKLGQSAPSQDEIIRLLSQLHQSDLLEATETPLLSDMLERRDKERLQIWRKLLLNPLSVTVPMIDPDRPLRALCAAMSLIPRAIWWLVPLLIVAIALALLPVHWRALTDRGLEGFLDLENLALIALIYPVVKAFHEIGHGVAVRARGGEVHEMGLMFIAFYPIPYVEASAALVFPSKWDRAAVAGAGVAVELVIASLAFLLWIGVEPGTARTILFNTMVISGLSTLAVNGNPLLKFDGYHVLCDLIEIPNLGKRGNEWWGEMTRVHLLGTDERARTRMQTTGWERLWFIFYPPAAFVYRVFISLTIALFVATTYRLVGVALALWSMTLMLLWPMAKTAHKAVTDPRIRAAGARAVVGAGGMAAVALFALFLVPLPHYAVVQGVTWLPSEAVLRAPQAGHIVTVAAQDGAMVTAGAPLLSLDAPALAAEQRVSAARLERAQAQYNVARVAGEAEAAQYRQRVDEARTALADARARLSELEMRVPLTGQLDLPGQTVPKGQFVTRGAQIGHILPGTPPVIRMAVPQDYVNMIRDELRGIDVRFASHPAIEHGARILREVPAGRDILPSRVLAIEGGGPFATVPSDDVTTRSVKRIFQFDLGLHDGTAPPVYGLRAHVRLRFSPKPLAVRVGRSIRSLFLSTFDV